MKKLVVLLLIAIIGYGSVYSQTKNVRSKRTSTSVAVNQKTKAEAKAKEEAEAKAKVEAEAAAAEKARLENNKKCSFSFDSGEFVSNQGYDGYVVYEIPEMTASELKSAVYTTLTSMFKSPKDAITNISDNIIQLEGYSPSLYLETLKLSYKDVYNHFIFNLVIQFKDGKVRYNTPTLKYLHLQVENSDTQQTVNLSGVNMAEFYGDDNKADYKLDCIERYFNNLIASINSKLKASNDW